MIEYLDFAKAVEAEAAAYRLLVLARDAAWRPEGDVYSCPAVGKCAVDYRDAVAARVEAGNAKDAAARRRMLQIGGCFNV